MTDPREPAPPLPLQRRTLLKGAALAAGAALGSLAPRAWARPPTAGPARVYLLVVDGLRAEELVYMPQLQELAAAGTFYPQARAQMIAETTPNHVSMITGVRSDRHGMPGNDVILSSGEVVEIGTRPELLQADSVFTLARRQTPGLVTAAVVSKKYIVEMCRHDRTGDGRPDVTYLYEPRAYVPISEHATDLEIMTEALRVSTELDPRLLWISLGDVDRVGHSDETGASGGPPAGRTATLVATDTQIRRLVDQLKTDGRWSQTVLLVTADHSMDWSLPNAIVSLSDDFEADPSLSGQVIVAQNGGAAMYALRQPTDARRARMRAIAVATGGVDEALYTAPNGADGGRAFFVGAVHPDWGLTGGRTGDLVVTAEDGFRITEPTPLSNPIPGNHGHVVTLPIPTIVTGGCNSVRRRVIQPRRQLGPSERDPGQAENIDLAPTVAWLLGLRPPARGFHGRILREAFRSRSSGLPPTC